MRTHHVVKDKYSNLLYVVHNMITLLNMRTSDIAAPLRFDGLSELSYKDLCAVRDDSWSFLQTLR